jgi:hypothetical protein
MKPSDISKLDSQTKTIVYGLFDLGFKSREIDIYTMYANVHISLPSAIRTSVMKNILDLLPDGSSISSGNNFRSGLTIRLPWNLI